MQITQTYKVFLSWVLNVKHSIIVFEKCRLQKAKMEGKEQWYFGEALSDWRVSSTLTLLRAERNGVSFSIK